MADIGFHDFEIGAPQRLLVTVEIWLDHIPPADCDDPAFAWDYDFLREQVEELATARRYNLQESLAHAIYDRVAAMRGVTALARRHGQAGRLSGSPRRRCRTRLVRRRPAPRGNNVTSVEQNALHGTCGEYKEARLLPM